MPGPWDRYQTIDKQPEGARPWEKYSQPEAGLVKPDNSEAAQTALESYGNAMTLGYLPHLQAGMGSLMGLGDYVELRDENIKRQKRLSDENPKSSMAGTGVGLVASSMLPLGAAAKGTGFLSKAAAAGKTGAAMGLVANPGDIEGEISPVQIEDRAKNAAIGAAGGVALQGAASGLGKVAKKAASTFGTRAENNAASAVGLTKAQRAKLGKSGTEALGRSALDEGVIDVLSTPSGIAKKAGKVREESGEAIGKLIKGADDAGAPKIDSVEKAISLLEDPEIIASRSTPGSSMYKSALDSAETLASNGELTVEQAHKLRKSIDQNINFNKRRQDLKPGEAEVLYKIRDTLNESINKSVNAVEGNSQDALKKAFKRHSNISNIQNFADKRAAGNAANRSIGLTDTIAGAAGMAAGGPVGGGLLAAGMAGANKFGRTFGDSIAARSYDGISKGASKAAGLLEGANTSKIARGLINEKSQGEFTKKEDFSPEYLQILSENPELIERIEDEKTRASVLKKIGRSPSGKK